MDNWFCGYAVSTIWPVAALLGASLCSQGEETWCRTDVDAGCGIKIDDLALEVALITEAHA